MKKKLLTVLAMMVGAIVLLYAYLLVTAWL